jgi:acyl dehydratase
MRGPTVGELLPEVAIGPLDRGLAAAYAAVSGDDNPLHADDAFAQAVGLPRAVAHGMFLMGVMDRVLQAWSPGLVVKRMESRFVRPVTLDSMVRLAGRVAQVNQDGSVTVRLTVREAQSAVICCIGSAECRPQAECKNLALI